jgi:hypothetical protein
VLAIEAFASYLTLFNKLACSANRMHLCVDLMFAMQIATRKELKATLADIFHCKRLCVPGLSLYVRELVQLQQQET